MPVARVKKAIEEIRKGRMVIISDDEDRENEGDLAMAAEKVTPEAINFMAKYGRGLICLSLTEEKATPLRGASGDRADHFAGGKCLGQLFQADAHRLEQRGGPLVGGHVEQASGTGASPAGAKQAGETVHQEGVHIEIIGGTGKDCGLKLPQPGDLADGQVD